MTKNQAFNKTSLLEASSITPNINNGVGQLGTRSLKPISLLMHNYAKIFTISQ